MPAEVGNDSGKVLNVDLSIAINISARLMRAVSTRHGVPIFARAQKRFGYGRRIAAPQIGVPQRVIFIDTDEFKGPLINPRASWKPDNQFEVWDSCFSFNVAFFVLVSRNYSIKAESSDQQGEPHLLAADKTLSELLQHELDHLDGILATDIVKDNKKMIMRSEWERKVG